MGVAGRTKFCIWEDLSGWKVHTVPADEGVFSKRVALKWSSLVGEDLVAASGIPGCVFVHINAFIGGNNTYEGALAMALRSLADNSRN